MMSRICLQRNVFLRNSLFWIGSSALALGIFAPPANASKQGLSAIELYDGRSGAAYVQLTDFFINGKLEMRQCTSGQAIDHSEYNKFPKVVLSPGGTLERGADGILRYSTGGGPAICVVPENVKFEHGAAWSLSEMADQANPTGIASGPSTENLTVPPPIKKGVTIVLVATLNTETADYLRARRASDIPIWRAFLSRYPSTSHLSDAKSALALLYVQAGQASLAAWEKSTATGTPSYSDLKTARAQADLALATKPGLDSAQKLDVDVSGQLTGLTNKGIAELNAWDAAMSAHTPGYPHLETAKKLSDAVTSIDPKFAPGRNLADQVQTDVTAFETAVNSANSNIGSGQYDKAFALILPYRSFADEEPRVGSVVDTVYGYHYEQAKHFAKSLDWQNATLEYEKAVKVHDTGEAEADLKTAREQLVITHNKSAAQSALASSQQYEQEHNILRAYEVLDDLPPAQRKLVQDDLDRLAPMYVDAASAAAKNLRQLHDPIKGIADEDNIEKAYGYLQRAYAISNNDTYLDRAQLLANDLSTYLLAQAKDFIGKPAGSGIELGWAEIVKAMQYKAANLSDLRDEQNTAAAVHNIRAGLAIRVRFRDQTSQRESAGFATQIENAIIAGLETSGVPVKVVREDEKTDVEPDFQLAGDVIQHHVSAVPTLESMDSHFIAGEEPVPNDAYNKANRDYEAANDELKTAQETLSGAEARGKHGVIESAKKSVAAAQAKVETLSAKRDSIPPTIAKDVLRPYTYTKKTISVSGSVQLRFSIADSLSEQASQSTPEAVEIKKEDKKSSVVLLNVSAEDSDGVKQQGTEPDQQEFLTELENAAISDLVADVTKRVAKLPHKIYDDAYRRENEGDLNGAGEGYLRYLNVTHEDGSVEREHAKKFLIDNFLLEPTPLPGNTVQASMASN